MTTVAIMMVKNEADIIADTITHLLGQVDAIRVRDNGSTDQTLNIIQSFGDPVYWELDTDPAYRQSEKMSQMASDAAKWNCADWILPVDADEIWYHPTMRIADYLNQIPADRAVVNATLYDHVATGDDCHLHPEAGHYVHRMGWRRKTPSPLHKVAARPSIPVTIEQGNHGAHYKTPMPPVTDGHLTIRHYPYRSAEQMTRKAITGNAALQAAPELKHSSGQHWRDYAALEAANPGAIADVFRQWFYVDNPHQDETLIYDPYTIA